MARTWRVLTAPARGGYRYQELTREELRDWKPVRRKIKVGRAPARRRRFWIPRKKIYRVTLGINWVEHMEYKSYVYQEWGDDPEVLNAKRRSLENVLLDGFITRIGNYKIGDDWWFIPRDSGFHASLRRINESLFILDKVRARRNLVRRYIRANYEGAEQVEYRYAHLAGQGLFSDVNITKGEWFGYWT